MMRPRQPPVRVVRGKPIIISIEFVSEPNEVYFSYVDPVTGRPHVDDGFGHPTSRIVRVAPRTYCYTVSTRGMRSGVGTWKFWSEGPDEDADAGQFVIEEMSAALL